MTQMLPDKLPGSHSEFDQWIIERAVEFTTVRFMGRGQKDRREFPTLLEAITDAEQDPRAMVYVITAAGRSTLVERAKWDEALALVGSKA